MNNVNVSDNENNKEVIVIEAQKGKIDRRNSKKVERLKVAA